MEVPSRQLNEKIDAGECKMEMPPYVEDGVAVVFSDRKQRGTGGRISQEYNAAAQAREGETLRKLSIYKTLMIEGAIA